MSDAYCTPPEIKAPERLLTQSELAREINVHPVTIMRGMRRGLFRPDYIAGRYQLFLSGNVAMIDAALRQMSLRGAGIQAGAVSS